MTVLRWGAATDVGVVREVNQDAMFTSESLFAVADGMGGHLGGEVAAATALEILESTYGQSQSKDDLIEAVRRANAKVWDKAQLESDLHGMGTTLTAVARIVDERGIDQFAIVNVGDSRTYLLRDGELQQLTSDHSFVEDLVQAGEISAEEAEAHPKRNILTRAIGVEPTVEADVETISVQPGDRLLLCSDGLVREVGDNQIAATLRRLKDPDEAAKDLVSQAKAAGGHDNITIIVVDVDPDDSPPPIAPVKKPRASSTHSKPRYKSPITLRVIGFIVVVGLLIAAGVGGVVWYARSSYYVGLEGEQLVIYQGRPEKVLWYEPTLALRSNVTLNEVLPSAEPKLREGVSQPSRRAADTYIANLKTEADQARSVTVPQPTTTTTTASGPAVEASSTTSSTP